MKFFEYLESHYVSTNIENQKQFSPALQAKTHAVQDLLTWQRKFYKGIAYFKLVFGYLSVKIGLSPEPKSPKEITEDLKAQAKLTEAETKRMATDAEMKSLTALEPQAVSPN